ncbi:unnamed protein product [Ostreobium quekettii]|uniref:Peroxiredoxin n=1 Tax=Ostreobium quekettii TaxID=121088 RepID=A0A8S1IYC0_9CHLO|nr:unnamed protein product [Ostreobium quekettii]
MRLPLPRRRAPHFKAQAVIGMDFKTVSLDDYRGKWLVLFFYPFDFTFVCPTEIVAFSNATEKLRELGAELAAVSCDSKHVHLSWTMQPREQGGLGQLQMPLISDFSKKISRDYGVLVEDEEDELCGAALRALFIIDAKGVIRSVLVNDEAVGRNVDETVRLIQAFQYADEHGETCPGAALLSIAQCSVRAAG